MKIKKGKNKGFTLVEVLAVIVILAIIALISTPIVLNIIEKTRKASFTRSLENIVKTGNLYYMEKLMDNDIAGDTFRCNKYECTSKSKTDAEGNPLKLDIDGFIGTGEIAIDNDGNISFELDGYGYCGRKSKETKEIKVTKGSCKDVTEDTTEPIIQNINTSKTENSITVVVNAYDDESGISFYEYSINGSEYKKGNNTYTFNDLSDGTYNIKVKVTNEVNLYTESEKEVIIEKAKPVCPTPVITIENKEDWTTSKNVTIDYGNVEGCTGKYSLDGSNFSEGTNITVNENNTIYAINEGGETTTTSQDEITTIDNTKPSIDVTGISSTTKTIEITFSSSDEQSGIKSTTCVYGETNSYGETETIEGNICKINNLKDDTTYYYKISTENNAGLTEQQEGNTPTGKFSSISITPSSENYERSKTYTVTGETNGATIEYKVTNGSTVKQDWTSYTEPILVDYASNEDSKTVIYARLNDGLNTSSEISKEETKIDISGPLNITLSSNSNSNYNQSLNVTVTLQDTGGSGLASGSIKYGWSTSRSSAPSYTTVSTSSTTGTNTRTFTASGSGLTGSYYLWVVPVNYKDKVGNSNTATVISTGTFNFDNTAPTLTLGTVTTTDKVITIPITANSDSHSEIKSTTCVAGTSTSNYNKTGTIANNKCTISGLNASTKYYYKVTTTDNAGNSTEKTGNKTTTATPITLNPAPTGKSGLLGIVYYDPVEGKECSNYIAANSATGTKSGCMKWYAYKETSTTYTMILDHNTTAKVVYNSKNQNSECKEACTQLTSDTQNWKVNADMITAQDIADITGNSSWTSGGSSFYLDSNSQTQTAKSQNASKYSWLFDYTNVCTSNGCNTADSSTYGYWTSTPYAGDSSYVWSVYYIGSLSGRSANRTGLGLRPVITISKV